MKKQRPNTLTLGDQIGEWTIEGFGRAGHPGYERAWKSPEEEWPEGTELVKVRKHGKGYQAMAFKSFHELNELANSEEADGAEG